MTTRYEEIRIKGKGIKVPTCQIMGREVVVKGQWIKTAIVQDEDLVECGIVPAPFSFIPKLITSGLKADIFTFAQDVDASTPKYPFRFEWDNAAVISTLDYNGWWESLSQESRKNTRRAAKKGVLVKVVAFDDEFVKGVKLIYDESPLRQGRQFWHYGKDIDLVKSENGTYLDRSEFIGAYWNDELIGFMKWTYVNKVAKIMQILSKNSHYDKRPMNALITKAAEVCHQKGMHYLEYSKFTYGNKAISSLAEFKRRMGFQQINFPRYYIPLTLRGKVALMLGAHRGLIGVLPPRLINLLLSIRLRLLRKSVNKKNPEIDHERTNTQKQQAEGRATSSLTGI